MDRSLAALLPLALVLAPAAVAKTYRVPAQKPTIQAAIDAADGDDTIVISKGTYNESITITGKSNIVLKGQGKVTIDGGGAAHAITLDGCDGITLSNIRVRNATTSGIFIDGGSGHRLKKCRGLAGTALAIETLDVAASTFDRCKVDGSTTDGILIDGEACHVVDATVLNVTGTGVTLRGPRHVFEKSHVEAAGIGLLVQDGTQPATGCIVDENEFVDCVTNAISFECFRSVIRDNEISGSGGPAILVNGSGSENVIEENLVTDSGNRAMSILGGRNELIRNVIDGAAVDGIGLIGPESSGNLVYANDCMNCTNYGYFVQGDGNSVIANDASSNGLDDYLNFASEPTNLTLANTFDLVMSTGSTIQVPTDQPTIAAALGVAMTNDVIELAPGTYAEEIDLTGRSDLTIRGAGPGDSIIDHVDGITMSGSGNIVLSQLVVRNAGMIAVTIASSDRILLDRVRVENAGPKSVNATAAKRVRLIDCNFADTVSLDVQAAFVDGCSIDGADQGIELFGRHLVVNSATLQNIGSIGIRIGRPAPTSFGIVVDGCTIAAAQDGIEVFDSTSSIVVRENTIGPTPANGIDVDNGAPGVIISHNSLVDCALNGVLVLDEENVLFGNSAKRGGNGFRTLGVDASGNTLAGNRTKKVTLDGFSIEGSKNAAIGNKTKKTGNSPYVDNNPGGANLALDNQFKS